MSGLLTGRAWMARRRGMSRRGMALALAGTVAALGIAAPAAAKEYVLVGSYGNQLHLIDPVALRVVRSYPIPGPGTGPTEMVPSHDGRIAYALTNRWQSVSGIDLDTGKEVFRADLSMGDVRVHALFGLDISPDNKTLYVYEQRARKKSDRVEVLDPVIAVYRTDAGTAAQPVRLMPAPRQIQHIAVSTDGRTIYAHGLDLYSIDAATGAVRDTFPVAHWQRPGYGPADSIAWLGEQLNASDIYAMAFYAPKVAEGASAPPPGGVGDVPRDVGVFSVNLKTGAMAMDIVGPESDAPGSATMSVNPRNPNEIFTVGGQLEKIDLKARRVVAHAPTSGLLFYVMAVSGDGTRIYTGGGHCRVGVYSTKDLSTFGVVEIPNCAVMGQSSLRIVDRPNLSPVTARSAP